MALFINPHVHDSLTKCCRWTWKSSFARDCWLIAYS